ncbi:MAG: outer membrane adhesin-like protein [Rhodocyclaceae bacterium]|nr:MAG: outer membrane adhesin-like protein [Rhodocyclaceae bacterium]
MPNNLDYTVGNIVVRGDGNDVAWGGSASDRVYGGGGDDRLFGGNGDDLLVGGDGDDSLDAGNGDDLLVGGDGDDSLDAGNGDDVLNGGAGDDTLTGGAGSDTYVFGRGSGHDTIGASGVIEFDRDTVQLTGLRPEDVDASGSTYGELVLTIRDTGESLRIARPWWWNGSSEIRRFLFEDGTQWSFEDALRFTVPEGTERDDTIRGSSADDVISGLGGDDELFGGAGNDVIDGGPGNDQLTDNDFAAFGGSGSDTYLFGRGDGRDVVYDEERWASSVDTLRFKAGVGADDIVLASYEGGLSLSIAGTGDSVTLRGYFNNTVDGLYNSGTLIEQVAFDDGTTWSHADVLAHLFAGSAYDDEIVGTKNAESIAGGEGDDLIQGAEGTDNIAGGEGYDTLVGDAGADTLRGGADDDELWGDTRGDPEGCYYASISGADSLFGDAGSDRLHGGAGDDSLSGGDDDDTLFGDTGDDMLEGGAGNDTLAGGGEASLASGDRASNTANGNDAYLFGRGDGNDVIVDRDRTAGNLDVIRLGADIVADQVQAIHRGGNLILALTDAPDMLTVRNWFLSTEWRVERIEFVDGTVWTQDDVLARATMIGTPVSEYLPGIDAHDDVGHALAGNDTMCGFGGNDRLDGGEGNDVVDGGAGSDILLGGEGADILVGGAGGDVLDGGSADDALYGDDRWRNGVLVGGADGYRFGLDDGHDRAVSFSGADDRVEFKNGVTPDAVKARRAGNDLVLTLSASDRLTLKDWALGGDTRIARASFADTTVWTAADLMARAGEGDATAETLVGFEGDDTLTGHAGDDTLTGLAGDDSYVFHAGDGRDTVIDDAGKDHLLFADIDADAATAMRSDNDLLIATLTGDAVTVVGWFAGAEPGSVGVATVSFADGTLWDAQELKRQALIGTAADDLLIGYASDDVLVGSAGDDTLLGGAGNDDYVFRRGDGRDTIGESDATAGNVDTLQLADLTVGEVTLGIDGFDLLLQVTGSDDAVRMPNWFDSASTRVERIVLADGTVWDAAAIQALVSPATSADDYLVGLETDDTLDGGAGKDAIFGMDGNDVLIGGRDGDALFGGSGSNEYRIGRSQGLDRIYSAAGAEDSIVFGPGIAFDDLSIQFRQGGWNDQEQYSPTTVAIGIGNGEGVLIRDDPDADSLGDLGLFGLRQVSLDDGTVLTLDELIALADGGVPGGQTGDFWSDNELRGSVASDDIAGGMYNDVIDARDQADEVYGGEGNDIIAGGKGADFLDGGDGSDVYVYNPGDGADVVDNTWDFGGSANVISFGGGLSPADVRAYVNGDGELVLRDGKRGDAVTMRGNMTYAQFIDLSGSYQAFHLGDLRADFSAQLAGASAEAPFALFADAADYIENGEGVWGGDRALVYAQLGDLFAQSLRFDLGAGDDVIDGSVLSDVIEAGDGDNVVHAGAGSDSIYAGEGNDVVDAGSGDDYVNTGDGNDVIDAGDGNDVIVVAGGGVKQVAGGAGDDTYDFSPGAHLVIDDQALPGAGNRLVFGSGIDWDWVRGSIEGGQFVLRIGEDGGEVRFANFDPADPRASASVDWIEKDGNAYSWSELFDRGIDVVGTEGEDVLAGGEGNDTLAGARGNDVYLFNRGDGNDVIVDDATPEAGNTLLFGPGITTEGIGWSIEFDDEIDDGQTSIVTLHVGDVDGSIIFGGVSRDDLDGNHPVDSFRFADGTTLSWSQLMDFGFSFESRNWSNWLEGTDRGDSFHAFGEEDYLRGNAGDDRYWIESASTYSMIIDDAVPGAGNTVYFGDGMHLDDARLAWNGQWSIDIAGEWQVAFSTTAEWDEEEGSSLYGRSVNNFVFADGTAIDFDGLLARGVYIESEDEISGTPWKDFIAGSDGNDTFTGGPGGDTLEGGEGDDTYIYNRGDGKVTINDVASMDEGNTLRFGANIVPDDMVRSLRFKAPGGGDSGEFIIRLDDSGDEIHILGFDPQDPELGDHGVECFAFADGSAMSFGEMIRSTFVVQGGAGSDELSGTAVADRLYGFEGDDVLLSGGGDDVLTGAEGDDVLHGGYGYDTYVFDIGSGHDSVVDSTFEAAENALLFGDGISRESLSFEPEPDGLRIRYGITDSVLLRGYGSFPNGDVVQTIQFADGSQVLLGELVDVAPVPVATLDAAVAVEDSGFVWTLPTGVFADADEFDTLNYSVAGENGTALPEWISFNAATLTLTGIARNQDVDSFIAEVTATDWFERSAMTSFTVSVANTNDAPEVGGEFGAQAATEDSPFAFTVPATAFSDVDVGDALILSATLANGDQLPAWLSFDAATATFSGTPLNDDVGSQSVSVLATDTVGASARQTFSLSVANTNDAPETGVALLAQVATEDSAFAFTLPETAFSDVDVGDVLMTLSASLANGDPLPGWLHFDAAAGSFTGTPLNDDVGSLAIAVSASDLAGATAGQAFVLDVANTNDAPVVGTAIPDAQATEDSGFEFVVPASAFADVDLGDTLSLAATLSDGIALPGWLSFDAATATFRGIPLNEDVGALSVSVLATDAAGATNSQAFTLSVSNTNDAPVANEAIASQVASEDSAFAIAIPAAAFVDVDPGDSLSYTASAANGGPLPNWLSFDAATRTFSGTPVNEDVDSFAVKVSAVDLAGSSASQTFNVSVGNTNDAPETDQAIPAQIATEDSSFAFTIPASAFKDVDFGDTLSLSARLANGDALPAWLNFDAATARFTGTPLNDDVGVLSVAMVATDAAGTSVSQIFALSVANTNDAPEVDDAIAAQIATEDAAFDFKLPVTAFKDVDVGDTLTLAATLANGDPLPAWLVFDAATGRFTGTPLNEDVGARSISVVAADSAGASASQSFALSIANTNDAPEANGAIASQAAIEDSAFSFTVPATAFGDVDVGDMLGLSATLANGAPLPAWLVFDSATNTFSGTPANEDVGTVTVRLSATDAVGADATQVFSLGVINVNDVPLTSSDSGTVVEDVAISASGNVLANDRDPDVGDVLAVSDTGVRQGSYGQLSLAAGGDWSYQLDTARSQALGAGESAVEHFTYAAFDGQLAAPGTLDIAVGGSNDAPLLAGALPAVKVKAGSLFSWRMPLDAFVDPDAHDVLGYGASLADGSPLPGWLSFHAASATFSGTPGPCDIGDLSVRLTARDGSGATAVGALPLTVALTLPGKTFVGTSCADALTGTEDDDVFDGCGGADTLTGRSGDDLYLVTDQRDRIVERANGGFDSVWADTAFTLPDQVEALAFVGAGDYAGNGNGLDNLLVGNRGENRMDGRAGDDILLGREGDDTLLGSAGRDALDGGSGDDLLDDGEAAGFIAGGRGDDTVRLGGGADVIAFNRGDDADRIQGGNGQNDTLSLGGGIRVSDIRLRKSGKDLVVEIGGGDSLLFADWYRNAGSRTVATLQVAVNTAGTLFDRYDFAGLAQKFDTVLAANRRIDSWLPGSDVSRFRLGNATVDVAGGSLAAAYASSGTLNDLRPETVSAALATPRSDARASTCLPDVPLPPQPSCHDGRHDDHDGHGHGGHGKDDRHDRDSSFGWHSGSGQFLTQREVEAAWQSWQQQAAPSPSASPIDYAMGWARLRDKLAGHLDEDDWGGAWCGHAGGARADGFLLTSGPGGFAGRGPIGLPGTALKTFEGLHEGFDRLHGS